MPTIHIKAATLKAAVILAAKQDIRYYLNGVLIQATAQETRVVATDGHLMGVFRDTTVANDVDGMVEFIIPRDTVDSLKVPAKPSVPWAQIEIGPDGRTCSLKFHSTTTGFTTVDGKFPDYYRVQASDARSGMAAQLDPVLIGRMHKAVCTMRGDNKSKIYLGHNGTSNSVRVTCGDPNFVGVIMPLRGDDESTDGKWATTAPAPIAIRQAA